MGKRKLSPAGPEVSALAWLLTQKPWIAPSPGTTKLPRLQEKVGAAQVALAPNDLRQLEQVISQVAIQSERYSAQVQQVINR